MMFPLQWTKLNEFSSVNKPQRNTQNRPQSDWVECLRGSKGETFFLNISKVVRVTASAAALTPHRPFTPLHVTSCTFPAILPACDESGRRKVLVLSVSFLKPLPPLPRGGRSCLTIKFQRQISCCWLSHESSDFLWERTRICFPVYTRDSFNMAASLRGLGREGGRARTAAVIHMLNSLFLRYGCDIFIISPCYFLFF